MVWPDVCPACNVRATPSTKRMQKTPLIDANVSFNAALQFLFVFASVHSSRSGREEHLTVWEQRCEDLWLWARQRHLQRPGLCSQRRCKLPNHKTVRYLLACSKVFPLINGKKKKSDSGKATRFCLSSCALRTEFGVTESKLSDFLQMLGNSQGWCW